MPKICQSDGAAASSNNEGALPNNQTETCSDSLTSVLSNRCSDDGIEVQEGVGCWMHWVSSDPTRLKALKERAIAKLVVNYGDQHRGERYRNASINDNGRMRRTFAYFKSGWKHYTSFDLDVKYSHEDAIVSYLTRRQIGVRNLDTVLVQFDELVDYLYAKSTFRLALTSAARWANRRAHPLRIFRFITSESLPQQIQTYPAGVCQMSIIFDNRLSMEVCYEHFFYLQDCLHLQQLTIILTEIPDVLQLFDFQTLLVEYIRILLRGRLVVGRLKLVLKFPDDTRRTDVLCTGQTILSQLDIDVMISWRKAVLGRRYIRHWPLRHSGHH